jgi:hypothetical protein
MWEFIDVYVLKILNDREALHAMGEHSHLYTLNVYGSHKSMEHSPHFIDPFVEH